MQVSICSILLIISSCECKECVKIRKPLKAQFLLYSKPFLYFATRLKFMFSFPLMQIQNNISRSIMWSSFDDLSRGASFLLILHLVAYQRHWVSSSYCLDLLDTTIHWYTMTVILLSISHVPRISKLNTIKKKTTASGITNSMTWSAVAVSVTNVNLKFAYLFACLITSFFRRWRIHSLEHPQGNMNRNFFSINTQSWRPPSLKNRCLEYPLKGIFDLCKS